MKIRLMLLLGLFSFFSIRAEKRIEVIYLTANAYCHSVEQIEKEAKSVIDSLFVTEKNSGTIVERKLNIMEEANQDFIHKYEISTNGLIFLVHDNEKCEKIDLNDFAFSNVPSDIPAFKKGLAGKIQDILNK